MRAPFAKDLVIIDFESSHSELEKTKAIQFAAIRLDKETLEEKQDFKSFLYINPEEITDTRLEQKGISRKALSDAPMPAEVAQKFVTEFGKDFLLSSFAAQLDGTLFRRLMIEGGINPSDFDYHIYDLWPVVYTDLLKQGYRGSIRSEPIFQALGLPPRGKHDALEDCRYAAEALRKIFVV